MTRFWRQFEQASPDSGSSGHMPGREEAEIARTLATLLHQVNAPDIGERRPSELLSDSAKSLLAKARPFELVAILMVAAERLRDI